MKILRIFLFLFVFSYQAQANSTNQSLAEINKLYTDTMGVSFILKNNTLDIFINQKKIMAYVVPRIQAMGIWPGINSESLKAAPTISMGLISIYMNIMVLKCIYNCHSAPCHKKFVINQNG
jgi:hypothetical protein